MSIKRRVVEKHDFLVAPYYEIQEKGLFGWHNAFPAEGGFPEVTYQSKEVALDKFNMLNAGDYLKNKVTVIAEKKENGNG